MYHKKYEDVRHTVVYGKQGCGKDMLIVHWLMEHNMQGKKIFANADLKIPHTRINTMQDVENSHDGVLYLHDMDLLFNSRDFILKKEQGKQEHILELVNNMRKRKLQLYGSCHRPKNIDVKLRTLIHYWISPKMQCIGQDKTNLWNWIIKYDVFDEFEQFMYTAVIRNLPWIATKYDTYETVKQLTNNR